MSVDGLHETLAPVYETLRRLRILMDNRLPKCTAQEFRLLMLLFRLIDWEKQTSGNFSYEELGKKLGGASLSTISRHVKRLKELGYIDVQRTEFTNRFSLRFPKPRPQKTKNTRLVKIKK